MPLTIDRGSGRCILLLHGQPGEGIGWDPVADRLVDRFRVIAPDRPGYGYTDVEPMGMAENADQFAELLRRQSAVPATVVGHSWSGGVAVLMADRHPDVVRSLVLAGAVGSPDSVNGVDRLLAARGVGDVLSAVALSAMRSGLPRLRAKIVSRAALDREPVNSPKWREGRRAVRTAAEHGMRFLASALPDESSSLDSMQTLGRVRRTFVMEQRALLAELPVITAALSRLVVPVSVVEGEWDLVVSPRSAQSLASAIPGAELFWIPAVGHFLARDAPDRLVEIIEATDRRSGASLARGASGVVSPSRLGVPLPVPDESDR